MIGARVADLISWRSYSTANYLEASAEGYRSYEFMRIQPMREQ